MNRKLIIGENSKIIKSIRPELTGFDFVSHEQVGSVDFSLYDFVFVFSWSYGSFSDNELIIRGMPAEKVVFISSTAVFSLFLRKQVFSYPGDKLRMEKIVLSGGGRVVRIGIWDEEYLKSSFGFSPVTERTQLVDLLNNWHKNIHSVTNLYRIKKGELSGVRFIIARAAYFLSTVLPSIKLLQMACMLVPKILNIKSYGYTADAGSFFSEEVLIGYGALGSAYAKKYGLGDCRVIVSGRDDIVLNEDGFRNSKVGMRIKGLSEQWHGVSILERDGFFFKKVPFWVSRPNPPKNKIVAHVKSVVDSGDFFQIILEDSSGKTFDFFSRKLVLAAGTFENSRILLGFLSGSKQLQYSDHEIGMIGSCSVDIALTYGYIKRFGLFCKPGKILFGNFSGVELSLDFRPYVPLKHISEHENNAFYLDSTQTLLRKMITGFSFSRINEAFFNKFGIGFCTSKLSVFVQAVNKNCISYDGNSFARVRFNSEKWAQIQNEVSTVLDGDFVGTESPYTVDAQHVVGGVELLDDDVTKRMIQSGRVTIVGSPCVFNLDAFHHTSRLQDMI